MVAGYPRLQLVAGAPFFLVSYFFLDLSKRMSGAYWKNKPVARGAA
jgi:hypothetical protein